MAQDKKFCYTSQEMDYWISCAYDAKAFKIAYDSMRIKVVHLETIIWNDSTALERANLVIKEKEKTQQMTEALSSVYEIEAKRERRWRRFWKGTTFGTGVVSGILIIYQTLKS